MSKGPQGRPDIPGYSRLCQLARGVLQLSRETQACERGHVVFTSCQPVFPGDSRSGTSARVVVQLSRVSRACVRGPAVSTSCPGGKGPGLSSHEVDSCHR